MGVGAAEVLPERKLALGRSRLGAGQRNTEQRVGTQASLVGRAVKIQQARVELFLLGGVDPEDRGGDLTVDVCNRLRDALTAPFRAAVAELYGLVLACGCAAGNRCASGRAGLESDLDLDGRVSAAVEDLPGVSLGYGGHE